MASHVACGIGVAHITIISPHQTANSLVSSHASDGIGVGYSAGTLPHQTADTMPIASDAAVGMAIAHSTAILPGQTANATPAGRGAGERRVAYGAIIRSRQSPNQAQTNDAACGRGIC